MQVSTHVARQLRKAGYLSSPYCWQGRFEISRVYSTPYCARAYNIGRWPPRLSTEMAIHMLGLAAHLYRQIPWHPMAKPLCRIGPDMPGFLASQTSAIL